MKGNKLLWLSLGLIGVGLAGIITLGMGKTGWMVTMMGDHRMGHGRMREMMRFPPGVNPQDLPDSESQGAKLLATYCAQCHALPDPKQHTASEWPAVVERMESHIQSIGRQLFTENEKTELTDYLIHHAGSSQ